MGGALFRFEKLTLFARVCYWICLQSQAAASVFVESWWEMPDIKKFDELG